MVVAFKICGNGGWSGKLVGWWTSTFKNKFNGKWKESFSHCELIFSDGLAFSASASRDICRYTNDKFHGSDWERIEVPANELKAREFCDSIDGAPYDRVGILGFVLWVRDSARRWFCSEVGCEALIVAEWLSSDINSGKVHPNKFKELIIEKLKEVK